MDYRVADHEDPVVWTWTDVSLALIVGGLSNSYLEFDLWKTTQMEIKNKLRSTWTDKQMHRHEVWNTISQYGNIRAGLKKFRVDVVTIIYIF